MGSLEMLCPCSALIYLKNKSHCYFLIYNECILSMDHKEIQTEEKAIAFCPIAQRQLLGNSWYIHLQINFCSFKKTVSHR